MSVDKQNGVHTREILLQGSSTNRLTDVGWPNEAVWWGMTKLNIEKGYCDDMHLFRAGCLDFEILEPRKRWLAVKLNMTFPW